MSIFEERPIIPKAETKENREKVKVGRYWPGKAPEWAEGLVEEEEEEEENLDDIDIPLHVEHKSDRRLERLKQEGHVDKQAALQRRREREVVAEVVSVSKREDEDRRPGRRPPNRDTVAEIVSIKTELPDDDEADDDADARRERARLQYLKKKTEEDEEMPIEDVAEEEKEEEESEGSEYETDSEYEDWSHRPTIQPVFVRKQERETIIERDKRIEEEERLEEERLKKEEERKKESLLLLKEQITREAEALKDMEENADRDERIDSDEEEEDEAKEYELWKQRELMRIKRDKEEREAYEREKEETERRRNMTDAEIRAMDKDKFMKDKKKWKFLQKYYHKGAFFQDGDVVNVAKMGSEDFSAPTGEDLIDKTLLPKVMQVKNFGRSGRTKYTHLADQDTSADSAWAVNDTLRLKYNQKMGGMHGGFDRPALKKRKTEV